MGAGSTRLVSSCHLSHASDSDTRGVVFASASVWWWMLVGVCVRVVVCVVRRVCVVCVVGVCGVCMSLFVVGMGLACLSSSVGRAQDS